MDKRILLVGILFLFSLTFVSAQPFSSESSQLGYEILGPNTFPTHLNVGKNFTFHVFNVSTGEKLQTTEYNCSFFLRDTNGNLLYEAFNITKVDAQRQYSYIYIEGGNFSYIGEYEYTVVCRNPSSSFGGGKRVGFFATINGKNFKTPEAIAYLGFIAILFFTFFMTLYGASQIRWKHKKSDEGKILSINHFRYVKILLYTLGYFELMFLFGLSYKLFNEAGIEGFTQFFNFIYQLFLNLMYPLMVALIIIVFVIWINNKKLKDRLNLGLDK